MASYKTKSINFISKGEQRLISAKFSHRSRKRQANLQCMNPQRSDLALCKQPAQIKTQNIYLSRYLRSNAYVMRKL
jgi:hypothetical protein